MSNLRTKQIIIATGNANKARELKRMLGKVGVGVELAQPQWLEGVVESGKTFVENALIKARWVGSRAHKPVIADDSGLVVPALDGAPGIYSARYAGPNADDNQKNQKLLRKMQGRQNRHAYFYCAIVLMFGADDPCPLIQTGRWDGRLLTTPKGESGFGYDPLFYLPEHRQSAAQMTPEEKNRLSHRGKAVGALISSLCRLWSAERARAMNDSADLSQDEDTLDSATP